MGDEKVQSDIHPLLEERGKWYGETWLIAGEIWEMLFHRGLTNRLSGTPYTHNWMLILSKLIRILFSPSEPDHWRDIVGYATLVHEHIQEREQWTLNRNRNPSPPPIREGEKGI